LCSGLGRGLVELARTHAPTRRKPREKHQPLSFQPKGQYQAGFIVYIALVFKALHRFDRQPGLAGEFFPAPAKHRAGLHTVLGGELVQDDLLFYKRAHCQRGHGGFSRFDGGRQTILCFCTVVLTAHQLDFFKAFGPRVIPRPALLE